jgi:hypothetical protein
MSVQTMLARAGSASKDAIRGSWNASFIFHLKVKCARRILTTMGFNVQRGL